MVYHLQLFLLTGLIRTLATLPDFVIRGLGRFLTRVSLLFAKKDLKKLRTNLARVYHLPSHSVFAKTFAYQVFHHQIMVALETFICGISRRHRESLEIAGYSELASSIQRLKGEGKGLIVVTGHLGNWELVAKYSADAADEQFVALAKPTKVPAVTDFIEKTRNTLNTKVLWTDRKSLLRDMMATLKAGQSLGFVMDQKPEGRQGPKVDFFGRSTEFVAGPAKLSIRTKAPILAIFCMREGPWRYRLVHKELVPAHHNEDNEIQLTQAMAAEIERVIRLYPEQWVWNYKRWRFN